MANVEYTVEETTATWRVNRFYLARREEHPWGGTKLVQHTNRRGQPIFYKTRAAAEGALHGLQRKAAARG